MHRRSDQRPGPTRRGRAGLAMWAIERLTPHSQQSALFAPTTASQIKQLADDIRAHGQREPVEVLPDGTILCGHCRVQAARLLGWTEVRVRVRRDLVDQPGEALGCLVRDNVVRRQLSPLGVARCMLRLREDELGQLSPNWRISDREKFIQQLAELLDMSTRNARRYATIALLPMPIQVALERRRMRLRDAERLAQLSETQLAEISNRIDAGELPREIVAEYLSSPLVPSADDDTVSAIVQLPELLRTALASRSVRERLSRMPHRGTVRTALQQLG